MIRHFTFKIAFVSLLVGLLSVGCGDEDRRSNQNNWLKNNGNNSNNDNNSDSNNDNNTSTNNTSTNNTSTNNTSTNNTSTNNTSTNNTSTNNTINNSNNDDIHPGFDTCPAVFGEEEACGGDPVGNWTLSDACTDIDIEARIKQLCPVGRLLSSAFDTSGTMELKADGTYNRDFNGVFHANAYIPTMCVQIAGDCSVIAEYAQSSIEGSAVSCSEIEDGCDCHLYITQEGNDRGSYSIRNNQVHLTSGHAFYFCAGSDTLATREVGDSEYAFTQFFTR